MNRTFYLFVIILLSNVFSHCVLADEPQSTLLNAIDRQCTHDEDCSLVFEGCIRTMCNCPSIAANKSWKPQCSQGIIQIPPPPNTACSPCYPFVARCISGRCEKIDDRK